MILLNDNHEVRAGWKFVIYVVFFVLLSFSTALALSRFAFSAGPLLLLALNELTLFFPAVLAMLLTVRFVDHRPLRTFGLGFPSGWRRDLFFGLGLATAMLAVLVAGSRLAGDVTIQWRGQASVVMLIATLGVLLLAALNEELIFRCFPLQILIDAIGPWPAMIGMSAIFGAMHLNNPNASILGTFNTMLAGILLSLAYVRTRSVWLPYAIHVGWNVCLGFVLGFPLSGIDLASLWTTGATGSETIVGGRYGPESGLLATLIFAASAVIVYRYGRIHSDQVDNSGSTGWAYRSRTRDS
jgi:membrane protease YdiL (CAAX protease family)